MNDPTSLEDTFPSLEINQDASSANRELLEKLRLGITNNPELYAAIFEIKVKFPGDGPEQFKAVNDYLHERPIDSDQQPNASDQWKAFLEKLPGEFTIASDYSFDTASTEAMDSYGPIVTLQTIIDGDSTSYSQRKELKEKLKIERLRFFLGRAVVDKAAIGESDEELDAANGSAA